MRKYEIKSMTGMVADVDEAGRKVKAIWSRMGNLDRDGDIITAGAFSKTIQEAGPKGANEIWTLYGHDYSKVLGKPSEIYEEGDALVTVTNIVDTEAGEDALKLYKAQCFNQHSIGFSIIKWDWENQDQKVRMIKEIRLYEGGPQLWGANPNTPTLGLTKSYIQENKDELKAYFDNLVSAVRNGNFTDKTFSLLEIQIKQIQSQLLELSTQPAEAVEPREDGLLKALRETNLKLQKIVKDGK